MKSLVELLKYPPLIVGEMYLRTEMKIGDLYAKENFLSDHYVLCHVGKNISCGLLLNHPMYRHGQNDSPVKYLGKGIYTENMIEQAKQKMIEWGFDL